MDVFVDMISALIEFARILEVLNFDAAMDVLVDVLVNMLALLLVLVNMNVLVNVVAALI